MKVKGRSVHSVDLMYTNNLCFHSRIPKAWNFADFNGMRLAPRKVDLNKLTWGTVSDNHPNGTGRTLFHDGRPLSLMTLGTVASKDFLVPGAQPARWLERITLRLRPVNGSADTTILTDILSTTAYPQNGKPLVVSSLA